MISKITEFYKKWKNYINIFLLIALLIFFSHFLSENKLIDIIKNINIKLFIISLCLTLFFPILITFRWYILIRNIVKQSFLNFFRNIIEGSVVGSITMTSLALDVYKFVYISNFISKKKSLLFVLTDKFLSIYFKVIFLILSFSIFYYFVFNNKIDFIFYLLLVFLILLIFLVKLSKKVIKFKILKKIIPDKIIIIINNVIDICNDNYLSLLCVNFFVQLTTVLVYALICISINIQGNIYYIALVTPIIETLAQLQVAAFGLREIVGITILSRFNLSHEESFIIAILFTFFTTIVTIIYNFVLILFGIKITKKNK